MQKNFTWFKKLILLCGLFFLQPLNDMLAGEHVPAEQKKPLPPEPLYLNLVWNLNAGASQDGLQISLKSPEIRHAATSHYFALAQLLKAHPGLHTTINISAETLKGIRRYTSAIGEFVDVQRDQFDYIGFLKKHGGKTDPWLDLLLVPSASLTEDGLDYMLNHSGLQDWHCFSVSPEILKRFPEYSELVPNDIRVGNIPGRRARNLISIRDRIKIKFFFAITHFDDLFLRSSVDLPLKDYMGNPVTVSLNEYFILYDNNTPDDNSDDHYVLARPIGDDDCQRLVLETYKVMQSMLVLFEELAREQEPPSKPLRYSKAQQVKKNAYAEFITTPASNAIVPLLYDTDLLKGGVDKAAMPLRFSCPEDASFQVVRAVQNLKTSFGVTAKGLCPTDGFVSDPSAKIYSDLNIDWILSGKEVLAKSLGKNPNDLTPSELAALYKTPAGLRILFAETEFTKALKEVYPKRSAEENSDAFFQVLDKYASAKGSLLTLIFDVDKGPDYYQKDFLGRRFLKTLLDRLEEAQGKTTDVPRSRDRAPAQQAFRVLTCTPSEYIHGSSQMGVPPHEQTSSLSALPTGGFEPDAFKNWMGSEEQKLAWTYLTLVRGDLKKMGLQPFAADAPLPSDKKSAAYFEYLAWESVLAAENAIWFKHYQQPVQKQGWQDEAFRTHLANVYLALQKAGRSVEPRKFLPIFIPRTRKPLADLDTNRIKFDGIFEESEWSEKAGILVNDASDSAGRFIPIRRCYYGMDENNLFLALDGGTSNLEKFLRDGQHLRIVLTYEQGRTTVVDLSDEKMQERGVVIVVRDNIAELRIPFRVLDNFDRGGGFIGAIFTQEKTYDRMMGLAIRIEAGAEPDFRGWPEQGAHVLIENVAGLIEVVFEVDAGAIRIPQAIYIAGDKEGLGNWKPNTVRLFDNGTHGDRIFNDKVWSRSLKLRAGEKVQYKYTNSGTPGKWDGQEFAEEVRTLIVQPDAGTPERMIVHDIFGVLMR